MDLGDILQKYIIVIVMVLLLAFNIFIKSRRGQGQQKTPLGAVGALLTEVDYNHKLLSTFDYHRQLNRFQTASWERNKGKLDFLPHGLLNILADTFGLAADFNERIDMSRKYKSDSYMASIDVRKMQPLLEKSRQGLEEWFEANRQNPAYAPKRRGLFG